MHLLENVGYWDSESEFVSPDGSITKASGATEISIKKNTIENKSWITLNGSKIENIYSITRISDNKYLFISDNPSLGKQKGTFSIDRNIIYSKFIIENSNMNGFEVISCANDVCHVNGALYKGEDLINSWRAKLEKKFNIKTI